MRISADDLRLLIARRSAPLMFALSLIFLVCQAILVVILVDVPNLSENARIAIDPDSPDTAALVEALNAAVVDSRIKSWTVFVMKLIWPIIIIESVFHWVTRPWDDEHRKYHFFGFLFMLCPSLRLCARSPEMRERIWLPGLSWRGANDRLRRRMQRQFSIPMIVIALMILPVLIVEFFMKTQVTQYAWLRTILHVSTGLIWFAFALEFILMVSVAKKKIAYCKEHWVDLAIILLPLLWILRSLRVLRATKLLRIPMITKLARMYRLRGTALKALRALVLLEFFQRAVGGGIEKRIDKLKRQLGDVEADAKSLRRQISKLQRKRDEDEKADVELADAARMTVMTEASGGEEPDSEQSSIEQQSVVSS